MRVTKLNIRLNPNEGSVKAFVDIVLDDCLTIHNIKWIEGKQRFFSQFPDKKYNDKFVEHVHPVTRELREIIEISISEAYQQEKKKNV